MRTDARNVTTILVLLISTLSGCADYPAVGTLSKGMTQSVSSWKPITGDYVATCQRRVLYEAGDLVASCAPYAKTQKQIEDDIAVLNGYFQALADIAVDSNYSVDPAIKNLEGIATEAKANGAQVSAAGALASIMAGWVTAGIRKNSLKSAINAVPHAIKVLDHVQQAINDAYPGMIEQEATQWRYYMIGPAGRADVVARLINPAQPTLLGAVPVCDTVDPKHFAWQEPAPALATMEQFQVQRQYEDHCNIMKDHRARLKPFDMSVDVVKKSLNDLYINRAKLKDKQIIRQIFNQSLELYTKAEALKKTFDTSATSSMGATIS